jgi:tRNA(Ile)-lysidine synthetase-like protein
LRLAPVGFDSRLARDFEAVLTIPGVTVLPERRLTMDMELVTSHCVYNRQMDLLDWEKCAGSLTLRNWRPGDSYIPRSRSAGRTSGGENSGALKIKTLFQDHRVPLWERRTWPVIVRGGSIVWTRRFGIAEEFAATPESGKILLIREIGARHTAGESKSTIGKSKESERARMKHQVPRKQDQDERGAEVL